MDSSPRPTDSPRTRPVRRTLDTKAYQEMTQEMARMKANAEGEGRQEEEPGNLEQAGSVPGGQESAPDSTPRPSGLHEREGAHRIDDHSEEPALQYDDWYFRNTLRPTQSSGQSSTQSSSTSSSAYHSANSNMWSHDAHTPDNSHKSRDTTPHPQPNNGGFEVQGRETDIPPPRPHFLGGLELEESRSTQPEHDILQREEESMPFWSVNTHMSEENELQTRTADAKNNNIDSYELSGSHKSQQTDEMGEFGESKASQEEEQTTHIHPYHHLLRTNLKGVHKRLAMPDGSSSDLNASLAANTPTSPPASCGAMSPSDRDSHLSIRWSYFSRASSIQGDKFEVFAAGSPQEFSSELELFPTYKSTNNGVCSRCHSVNMERVPGLCVFYCTDCKEYEGVDDTVFPNFFKDKLAQQLVILDTFSCCGNTDPKQFDISMDGCDKMRATCRMCRKETVVRMEEMEEEKEEEDDYVVLEDDVQELSQSMQCDCGLGLGDIQKVTNKHGHVVKVRCANCDKSQDLGFLAAMPSRKQRPCKRLAAKCKSGLSSMWSKLKPRREGSPAAPPHDQAGPPANVAISIALVAAEQVMKAATRGAAYQPHSTSGEVSKMAFLKVVVREVMQCAGGLAGGVLGAVLGTLYIPVVGTALGGTLGALIGDALGQVIGRIVHKHQTRDKK